MSRLPKVAKEIKYSLYKTIKDMATDKKKSAYLKSFWKGFKDEQPELANIVRGEMENFKNAHEMGRVRSRSVAYICGIRIAIRG